MKKSFDCLEMKEAIQEKIQNRLEGMSAEQMNQAIRDCLSASQSPIGRLWRQMEARDRGMSMTGFVLCETEEAYCANSPAE